MAQDKLTAKQQEILEYIKITILKKGYPPAVRDICEAVKLKSTSSVHSHLSALEEKGYIHRDPTKPRAIEILDDTFNFNRKEMVNIPVIGTVAAGDQLIVEQRPTAENGEIVVALLDDSATVKRFFKETDHYRLQPENDAMDPIITDHVEILGRVIGLIRMM